MRAVAAPSFGRRRGARAAPNSGLENLAHQQAPFPGVPLVVVSTVSAVLGVAVAQGVLRISGVQSVSLPDLSPVAVPVAGLTVAMGVVTAPLPAVDRLTRPQSLRSE